MDEPAARREIARIFSAYKRLSAGDRDRVNKLRGGKLYELYVLSYVLERLRARGFRISFYGRTLRFKSSPGQIRRADPHFELRSPTTGAAYWIFVDIEFETLGSARVQVSDRSLRHEVDIVVVSVDSGYPKHSDILLGVECKAVANFSKSILKEVLGVRRELSLVGRSQSSLLSVAGGSPNVDVPADPPSEYWLAYIDPIGDVYAESPKAFGVEFMHLAP